MLKTLKRTVYNPIRTQVKRTKEFVYFIGFVTNKSYQKYVQVKNKENVKKHHLHKRLLFVGSGISALEYKKYDLSEVEVLTVNNSIKAFDHPVDYYLCSTNFPTAQKPNRSMFTNFITKTYYRYDVLSHAMFNKLGFRPQIGKTVFLDGLYWAMASGFKEIYLLGFDHDYNKKRVEKWQGKYITSQEKLAEIFNGEGEEPDAFYGQNTPDPLRHGQDNLTGMFILAKEHAKIYGCKIYNLSSRKSDIDVFERTSMLVR